MRKIYSLVIILTIGLFFNNNLFAQSGCIDSGACNYDETAVSDDGSCVYAEANADCDGNCDDGFIPLTLEWIGADNFTTFTVTGLDGVQITSQSLASEPFLTSDTQCWSADLQADCFTIDIEGPVALLWDLYSPLSTEAILSGTNEDITFGSECVLGCTDATACNYDSSANDDDGTCYNNDLGCGCDTPAAEAGFDCDGNCLSAVDCNGVCGGAAEDLGCGCGNPAAEAGFDCDGNCLDSDGDGICDDAEVVGCMDDTACNYDVLATDNEGCIYAEDYYDCDGNCADDVNDPIVQLQLIWGGNIGETSFEVETQLTNDIVFSLEPTTAPDSTIYVCMPSSFANNCYNVIISSSQDNDFLIWSLQVITDDLTSTLLSGTNQNEVFGGTCTGCTEETACNYNDNEGIIEDNSLCVYSVGCETCNGETGGFGTIIDNDADGDGVCDADEIEGCTDEAACNYDSSATDLGDCIYPEDYTDCFGNCLVDDNDPIYLLDLIWNENNGETNFTITSQTSDDIIFDGISSEPSGTISACFPLSFVEDCYEINIISDSENNDLSWSLSSNLDGAVATVLEGSNQDEIYGTTCTGCTDETACNYNDNEGIIEDNSLCIYPDGICDTCDGETGGFGTIIDNDADGDGVCDADEIEGCTDSTACNFNESATEEDGSCIYATNTCVLAQGDIVQENPGTLDANISASGDNWELTECTLEAQTNPNSEGIVTATFSGGMLTIDCDEENPMMNIQVDATFEQDPATFYPIGDITYSILYDGDVIYEGETAWSVTSMAPLTGSGSVDSFTIITDGCDYCSGETDGTGVVVDGDTDNDGVCDADEIEGCQDETACNYNADATDDDGSCILPVENCTECCEYSDGTWTHLNPFNPDSGDCTITAEGEGGDWSLSSSIYYDAITVVDTENNIEQTTSVFISDENNPSYLVAECHEGTVKLKLIFETVLGTDSIIGDVKIIIESEAPAGQGEILFESTAEITFFDPLNAIMKGTISGGTIADEIVDIDSDDDGLCDDLDIISGCTNMSACNYNNSLTVNSDDELCVFASEECEECSGEEDGTGVVVLNDIDSDGLCDDEDIISGCTNPEACNYNNSLTVNSDDELCEVPDYCEECSGEVDGSGTVITLEQDPVEIYQFFSTTLVTTYMFDQYTWYSEGNDEPLGYEPHFYVTEGGDYYVVVNNNNESCEQTSNTISFTQDEIDAMDGRMDGISLYPNPTDGLFYLETTELEKTFVVDVYDNLGRLISTYDNRSNQLDVLQLDLSMFTPSIYNVVIRHDNGKVWNKQIIKK